jgi:glycosyltransferase involved in cell wall biosynthesis
VSAGPAAAAAPRASIIIPARDEGTRIAGMLDRLLRSLPPRCEVLVVVDSPADSTVPVVAAYREREPSVSCLISTYGPGPANAIRYGMGAARAAVAVVTMADGCDDPRQAGDLIRLVERGAAVAAASRYMPGGRQVGGPLMKSMLSRAAGRSLHLLARLGTCDATNSFKAYSTQFVREAGIDSRRGFEVGIELTAKARRLRLPVAEVPTTWLGRTAGKSHFRLASWMPAYLRWYRFAFGPGLTAAQLRARTGHGRP